METNTTQALANQTVLIVGAGRGIGLAWVEHLLKSSPDQKVIAAARQASGNETLACLIKAHPSQLQCIDLDVTDEASVARACADIKDKSLGCVVNTTGVLHDQSIGIRPEKRIEDLNWASFESLMRINAFSNALLLQHLLPKFPKDQRAYFAALSARVGSISDNRVGGWYSYRASKAALNQLLKTASIETKRRYPHLILAALHPGTTDTRLSKPFQANVAPEKLFSPEFVAERLMAVLLGLGEQDSGGFFAWDGEPIPY